MGDFLHKNTFEALQKDEQFESEANKRDAKKMAAKRVEADWGEVDEVQE